MIIFSLVAREEQVLAEHSITTGNFQTISSLILAKIPQNDSQMSFVYDRYFFHYLKHNGITFLCLASDEFPRRKAFAYLTDLEERFVMEFGERAKTVEQFQAAHFGNNIGNLINTYSTPDQREVLKLDIENVKSIMVANIERVLERGDRYLTSYLGLMFWWIERPTCPNNPLNFEETQVQSKVECVLRIQRLQL
jgi:vesicle-associated membrane protein 7